jgi:acyl-[acyl-carrier-protein]-phospholipid O-acyltransferase/long-chain-fatty-acid--[acyl-carrier-protein] ligase
VAYLLQPLPPSLLADVPDAPAGWAPALIVLAILAVLVFTLWRRPRWALRAFLWLVCHTFYRVRVIGRQNVPARGAALLVCNHVTHLDWLIILAAQKRFIRFVIFSGWTKTWGLRHLLRWARVIPINAASGPRKIVESLRMAADALAAGDLVCIFAEGRFTRTGFLLPFHRGFEQIVKHCPAPIVPVCLDQLWGSIFSFRGGKIVWKWPQRLPKPATIAFGEPLPPGASAAEVRLAIQKLSADAAVARSDVRRPVQQQFRRKAARHPLRPCLIDGGGRQLNYGQVAVHALGLARQLRPLLGDAAMVGVRLPPSAAGAFANIALALLGKTVVNVDASTAPERLTALVEQCKLRHLLTQGEQVPLPGGVERLDVSRLPVGLGWQHTRDRLALWLLPAALFERRARWLGRAGLDALATVVFKPEGPGVMLSHRNLAADCESMVDAIDVRPGDRALAVLPLSTTWGYAANLWAPLQVGASVVFPADPSAEEIGGLCRKHRCTVLLITPALLRACLEGRGLVDFASLRILMCGADPLPEALAKEFETRFGVRPLEGYGCPELCGAATANVPDKEMEGFRQIGTKPGTVGQPLPGMAARIVNGATFEPLPAGHEGVLLVYGANVMVGYFGQEERTRQVLRDGWFVTGQRAVMDEDGFITLRGGAEAVGRSG